MGRVDRAFALLSLFGMAADEEDIGRRDHLPCRRVEALPGFDVALPGLLGVADEFQVARVDVLRAVPVGLVDGYADRSAVPADQGAVQSVPAPRVQFDSKQARSEEHTSELQSLMRISYAVFC